MMMGWLKTMKSIKYLVLLVFLINCNQLAIASPRPDGATKNESTTTSLDNASNSSSKTTTTNRERSTKVSSERLKASASSNNEDAPLNATLLPSRRITNGRIRDNQLMSVLSARRRTQSRWRSSDECERHCRINKDDEYCKLKCSRDMKLFRNINNNKSASESATYVNEMSTSHSNLVQSNADEFLDTEESVHGLYFTDPSNNITINSSNNETKESSNLISSDNGKSNIPEVKSGKKREDLSQATTSSTTVKINRRNKYARTSLSPSQARTTVYRGRIKFSPSNLKSYEEIDSDPYLYVGQKLAAGTTSRVPEVKRQPNGRRTTLQSTTPSRSKEEELEIMEVSVAKQSSTEKNKFWKTRNIVAINNYMRRLNPHMSSIAPKIPVKIENTTKLTTVRYETIHSTPKISHTTSISAVNNLAEGIEDVKNVKSRSAENASQAENPIQSVPEFKTIYQAGRLPGLIINVPDDASILTPVFYNDHRNYQQSDGEIEPSPIDTTEALETTTSPTVIIPKSDQEPSQKLPDINRLFKNITTTHSSSTVTDRSKTQSTLESTISSSTTTSVVKSTASSTESFIPAKSTKRVYTTIPRKKSTTTVFPDYNKTTISTFLSNISSRRNKVYARNETLAPSTSSTTPRYEEATSSTTISYKIARNSSKTPAPVEFDVVVPPSVTPEPVTPSIQTNVFMQGISTTNKPTNNDVVVEMYKMNTATYVMAGLGLLPLVVILIYVVRQYLYRHEHKDGDSENYGNDIQPISPVATLDHSDDGASIGGDESIISETDFNRNNLRFKSLLGEGNFGQVWKAEADNLAGHLGTTRIVAVKTERANNGQGGLKAECEIMRKLGSHSNVVTLLGACVEQEPHLLIMEYAMRGRLLSLLRAARGVLNGLHHPPSRQPVMPLSPRRLTGFALDIARGMEYIAEKKIVHRDLAARNVLLDHNGICKICDFGMSIDLDKIKASQGHMKIPRVSPYHTKFKFDMTARVFGGLKNYATSKTRSNCDTNKNRPALPIRWMAPEALQYHVYSVETDVFAFGIVLWELATLGITPYPTLSGREVLRGVPNGVRPEIPSSCRQELSETMTHCWHKDPNQRPSFTDVRKSLSRALLQWQEEITTNVSEYIDVSGFSEDYENGMIYFNRRVSEFECEI